LGPKNVHQNDFFVRINDMVRVTKPKVAELDRARHPAGGRNSFGRLLPVSGHTSGGHCPGAALPVRQPRPLFSEAYDFREQLKPLASQRGF
jgi:hypothetical protein